MFPTPFTVQREAHVAGVKDARGNPVDSWAAPVDVAVCGWVAPGASTETTQPGREFVECDLVLTAPSGTVWEPKDRVIVDGDKYDVSGKPADFEHVPWTWPSGSLVHVPLSRVEG